MKLTSATLTLATLVSSAVLLASCASGASFDRANSNNNWGNYKCYARTTQNGRPYQGWSTSQRVARSNAISKCETANHGGSCRMVNCENES